MSSRRLKVSFLQRVRPLVHRARGLYNQPGWLVADVRSAMKQARAREARPSLASVLRQLAFPEWRLLGIVTGVLAGSILISWILRRWGPCLISLDTTALLTAYSTMWQVQAGIAAVALPILLFVIELSKEERQAAMRSHEVLIRDTWIFPIILFSLSGTLRLGIDMAWFLHPAVFLFDLLIVLGGTIAFTCVAYLLALSRLFSPTLMKARAMSLAREKMSASLDASIRVRLANGRLGEILAALKVGYWFFSPERDNAKQYAIVRAPALGVLSDIHLGRLEAFVRGLPWRSESVAGDVSDTPTRRRPLGLRDPKEHIWILKRYGENLSARNDAIFRLDRSAFDDLDVSSLELQLVNILKITGSPDA